MALVEIGVGFLFAVSAVVLLANLRTQRAGMARFGLGLLGVGLLLSTGELVYHWLMSSAGGVIAFSGASEVFGALAWVLALLVFLVHFQLRNPTLGTLLTPIAALLAVAAPFLPEREVPIARATASWLFSGHVIVLVLGIGCFVTAFLGGVLYLLQQRELKAKRVGPLSAFFPSLESVDRLVVRTLVAGFLWLTLGIASGIGLAHFFWPKDWYTDPKFILSSLTWGWYLLLLAVRYRLGWRGARFVALIVIGFVFLLIIFLGFTVFRVTPPVPLAFLEASVPWI